MRIAVSAGHNIYVGKYFDPGATNPPFVEADINKETVAKLIPLLQAQGHEVLDVTPYNEKFPDSKSHHVVRCNKVDMFKADLFLDIHINAGGGTGVETWVYSKSSKAYIHAKKVVDNLSKNMNLFNRGTKEKPGFWSVSLCKAPAMIVEGAFIDNIDDMQKLTPEKYAIAIAECFGEVKQIETEDKIYKIQVGAFKNKDNAIALLEKLNTSGFSGVIVEAVQNNNTTAPGKEEAVKNHYRVLRRFDSNIHIYEVGPNDFVDVELGRRNTLETVSNIVKDKIVAGKKVKAAVNCGFVDYKGNKDHLGMLIDDGLYYTAPHNAFIDFIYYKDGTTKIVNLHGYDKNLLSQLQREAYWAIGTSYSLVQQGKINLENKEKFPHHKERHPRTLFGQKKNGSFILVVVDGRSTDSKGITAQQSAEIMLELGCFNAVNVDGGGSSTMVVVDEKGKAKVVNKVSDGVERAIGSILIVYEREDK